MQHKWGMSLHRPQKWKHPLLRLPSWQLSQIRDSFPKIWVHHKDGNYQTESVDELPSVGARLPVLSLLAGDYEVSNVASSVWLLAYLAIKILLRDLEHSTLHGSEKATHTYNYG
jgi:hypothetical protein